MKQSNTDDIKSFFNSWSTYDKVVHFNYMAHSEIFASLRRFLDEFKKEELNILDVGCGDCRHIPEILDDSRIKSFTGVDISSTAISDARKKLDNLKSKAVFVEDDFVNYIRSCEDSSFNLLIAGYSAHHLFYDKKQEFFDNCFRVLQDGGCFIHYDLQRLENETRNQYIERYYGIIDKWEKLNFEERLSIKNHITESDFPSSMEEALNMIKKSGFSKNPGVLFVDNYKTHILNYFIKTIY